MPQAEFRVGREEKHTIWVDVSTWTNFVSILVDGKNVPPEKIRITGFVSDYGMPVREFVVGEKERHQVEVKVDAGAQPRIELYADGKLVPARSEA